MIDITPPAVGDTTKLDTFAIPVLLNLKELGAALSVAKTTGILNGSFEQSTGANVAPASWDLAMAGGYSCGVELTSGNVRHGAQSFRMTNPSGVTGGVILTTADYYPVGELQSINLAWFMKSTAAATRNQVLVSWYDSAKNIVSTFSAYDNSATNSTVWSQQGASATAPAGARFYKVALVGCNNALGVTVWWDGVTAILYPNNAGMAVFTAAGAATWLNTTATKVRIRLLGGGAGAARHGDSIYTGPFQGGGGGAFLEYTRTVVPGTTYNLNVGIGGQSGTNSSGLVNGADGGDSWFDTNAKKAAGGKGGIRGTTGGLAGTPDAFSANTASAWGEDGATIGTYTSGLALGGRAAMGFGRPSKAGLTLGPGAGGSSVLAVDGETNGNAGFVIIEPIYS